MTLSDLLVPPEPAKEPTCRFCSKPVFDTYLMLCKEHYDYTRDQSPPRGGRAAGAAFEVEDEEPLMAIGVGK